MKELVLFCKSTKLAVHNTVIPTCTNQSICRNVVTVDCQVSQQKRMNNVSIPPAITATLPHDNCFAKPPKQPL